MSKRVLNESRAPYGSGRALCADDEDRHKHVAYSGEEFLSTFSTFFPLTLHGECPAPPDGNVGTPALSNTYLSTTDDLTY